MTINKTDEKILSDILDFQAKILKAQSKFYQDLAQIYDCWSGVNVKQELLNEEERFEKVR
jgi:hypothetical protein